MRIVKLVGSAILSLALGAVPAFSEQDEKHDQQDRPEQRDEKAPPRPQQDARPGANQQPRPEDNRPAQEDRQGQEMDRRQHEDDRRPQGQEQNQQQIDRQREQRQNTERQEDRGRMQQQNRDDRRDDQRTDQREQDIRRDQPQGRREVAHGQRIPEERFRSTFGREHHFHINRPVVVEGAPQVVYGGYTFVLAEPWPAEWAYTDDFYVDYVDDTYYLYDPFHPGVQVALNIIE